MNMPAPGGMPASTFKKPEQVMPAPTPEKPATFGDLRPFPPAPAGDMPPLPGDQRVRKLKPGCEFPEIQTYRQTNGPMYLTRFRYNSVWIAGVGQNEAGAVYLAQQFYMNETKQGREDSDPA